VDLPAPELPTTDTRCTVFIQKFALGKNPAAVAVRATCTGRSRRPGGPALATGIA
jgi:hypothetical protein